MISFPKAHEGRSIKDIALGSVFGLSTFEILATPYGRPEQQVQLCIDELMVQMTGVTLGVIGRPLPLHSRASIKSLLEDFLQLEYQGSISEESSISHQSRNLSFDEHQISQGLKRSTELDVASQVALERDDSETASLVDTAAQSELATQIAPHRKRKRDSEVEQLHGVNLDPPVSVRAKSKSRKSVAAPDLLALIEKPVRHSTTSESDRAAASKLQRQTIAIATESTILGLDSSQAAIDDRENDSMNLTKGQLEPNIAKPRYGSHPSADLGFPTTPKLADNEYAGERLSVSSERFHPQDVEMQTEQAVVNDARAYCNARKVKTSKEGTSLQQQPHSGSNNEQLWSHIFETTPAAFKIPKRQQDILNRSDSWNPAPPGKTFPAGNLPREILEELQQSYLERQKKSSTETSQSFPSIDTPKLSFNATSEISSPSSDGESLLSGWHSSPVDKKTSAVLPPDCDSLPPDSSPLITLPKTVAEDVEENTNNVMEGDINKMDEMMSSYDRGKEDSELCKEQEEASPQVHKASHAAFADTDVEMSLASDSDMETSVPHALQQISPDPPSIPIQNRSRTKTPQTQEQKPAESVLQIAEKAYGSSSPAQKQNVTSEIAASHASSPLCVSSLKSARNQSEPLVPGTFTSSKFKAISAGETLNDQPISGIPLEPFAERVEQRSDQEIESSVRNSIIKREFSASPLPNARDRKRTKPLGDIQFTEVVTKDPANVVVEKRRKWFARQGKERLATHESARQPKPKDEPVQSTKVRITPEAPRYIGTHQPGDHPVSNQPENKNALLPEGSFTTRTPALTGPGNRNAVFQAFRAAYPEYTGTVEHFTQLCRKLRQSKQHQAVWDDYVIRHLTDYEQYVMVRLRQGSPPIDYDDYYSERVRTLKFTKGILNAQLLDALLPKQKAEFPSRRHVEHHRPRDFLDSYRPGRAKGWFSSPARRSSR